MDNKPTIQDHIFWGMIIKLMCRLTSHLTNTLDATYYSDSESVQICEDISTSLTELQNELDRNLFTEYQFKNIAEAKHVYYGSALETFEETILNPTIKIIKETTNEFLENARKSTT